MIIHPTTGHTMKLVKCDKPAFEYTDNCTQFYEVRNWDSKGVVFMYVAKSTLKNEVLVWYPNGNFWSGFGKTYLEAVNGAIRDGWMYAR